jgi:hypothetical protein
MLLKYVAGCGVELSTTISLHRFTTNNNNNQHKPPIISNRATTATATATA